MKAACLIPTTRPGLALRAANSALADGWDVITEPDLSRTGPCATRNRLFSRAMDEGYELIRYADDDDIVLPHLAQVIPLFEAGADLVYADFIRVDHNGYRHYQRFSPNPQDVLKWPPDCWGWIATADALKRAGHHWPEDVRVVEGYFVFLSLFSAGLKMRYAPVPAYEYHMARTGLHADPDAKTWYQKYLEELRR